MYCNIFYAGFQWIMFDDNYPNIGDNLSMKSACKIEMGTAKPSEVMYVLLTVKSLLVLRHLV